MTFIAPFALGLAALAAPIVILYMLRSRRARRPVSSTMLWDVGRRSVSANAPWQPLRFSWLLLLQLLALALVVLAVARPARPTAVPLGDHTVLIIDTSASMQADDGGRNRLESAKRQALKSVGQLSPGKRMSVVEAGPRARVVLSGSTDRRAIVEAISSLRPTDGPTDAGGAFALGSSLETPDTPTVLHFYSDGGVRPEDRDAPGSLVHIPIGSPAGNVAIGRLSVAPKGAGWDVFVRIVNAGSARVDAALVLEVDGGEVARESVRLDPQGARDTTMSISRTGGGRLTARLENVRAAPGTVGDARTALVNGLAVDDTASATLDRGSGLRVLLMTPGNVFLESLLRSIPGSEVSVGEAVAPARGFTLAIYDRVTPPDTLEAPSLVIAASKAPGLTVTGSVEKPVVDFLQPREPIVEQVDLSRLAIRIAKRIRTEVLRPIVAAGDDPMLAVGVPGGRRMAYLAFDLRESNLPVQVAFPLLLGNLVSWLTRGEGPDRAALVAGNSLPLRVPGRATSFSVELPGGFKVERPAGRAVFDETDRAGFYRVRYLLGKASLGEETFAVNVPGSETSLSPRPVTGKLEGRDRPGLRLSGLRAWGPGFLAAALVVLLAEWWLAHGRPGAGQLRRRTSPAAPGLERNRRPREEALP